MFVLVTIFLSAAILGLMYYSSMNREASFQRKYELVSDLRTLVNLCREHRSLSHHILHYGNDKRRDIELIEKEMRSTLDNLINRAHFDNKSIYRILQSKLNKLIDDWDMMSVSQNQMAHGRSIRHCLFLIDEVILAWLIESQRLELSDEYNLSWQQIMDSLEALTQFRVAIQDAESEIGYTRLKLHSNTVLRRLNQLAIINPLAIASPACSHVCKQLEEIIESDELHLTRDNLYTMSTDASLIIFNSYDLLLSEIAETLYIPLPKLTTSA